MHYSLMLFISPLLFLFSDMVIASTASSQKIYCQPLAGMSLAHTPFENKNILFAAFTAGKDDDVRAFIARYNTNDAEDAPAHTREELCSLAPQLIFIYAHYIALGEYSYQAQMHTSCIYFDILSRVYGLKDEKATSLKHILYDILHALPETAGMRICQLEIVHDNLTIAPLSTAFSFVAPFLSSDIHGPWEDEEIIALDSLVYDELSPLIPSASQDLIAYAKDLFHALTSLLSFFYYSSSQAQEAESVIAVAEEAAPEVTPKSFVPTLGKSVGGVHGLRYLVAKQHCKH